MIKVVLHGGLGNQMFQYALGVVLAEENNASLVLDTTFLNDRFPRKELTFRNFDLDIFTLTPQFTFLSKMSGRFPIPGLWVGLDIVESVVRHVFGMQKMVLEKKNHAFDPNVLQAKGNILIDGFWQSEKYFSGHAGKIRQKFSFKDLLEGEAKNVAQQIASSNSVSLHVRRGDYISYKSVQTMMGDVGVDYYKNAMAYISTRVKDPHFFVFSNDIEWCKKNIISELPITYLTDASAGRKAGYHMHLMSMCKNNIIANSTFSWWAAWLNNNPEKIVVAPKQWSLQDAVDKNNIIPKGWITI